MANKIKQNPIPEVKKKETEVAKKPSERDFIISEKHELNIKYKTLIGKKQQAGQEMQKIDEEILKTVGAFQALKVLLEKLDKTEVPAPEEPFKNKEKENISE